MENSTTISAETRLEIDSLGEIAVPLSAYWGAHTARALENFQISGIPISRHPHLVRALVMVKKAAAQTNRELGELEPQRADAIIGACDEVLSGRHREQFCVDVIQGGAGTSTNMNTNEVLANIGLGKLGLPKGSYASLHPIDDVNRCQSTNDVYPSALKLAMHFALADLQSELRLLAGSFTGKGKELGHIMKVGRTQLQDAVPMTLGQEFEAFGATLHEEIDRIGETMDLLRECSLGATAIGTEITAAPGFRRLALRHLSAIAGIELVPAANLIEATSDTGVFMHASAALKRASVKMSKICSDLRLLSSGPQAGFGEIMLPPRQAGSSIMPGKVNPVIPEVVNQICFAVVGSDVTVTMASDNGQLQLNAFEPVMAHSVLQSISWLINGAKTLRENCVDGIVADEAHLARRAAESISMITALIPAIGYAAAADLAKLALESRRRVLDLVIETGLMGPEAAADLLRPRGLDRQPG